jgi:hypothetical protein
MLSGKVTFNNKTQIKNRIQRKNITQVDVK